MTKTPSVCNRRSLSRQNGTARPLGLAIGLAFSLIISMLISVPAFGQTHRTDPSARPLLGQEVTWDSLSLFFGGRRVVPVMGEVHYSRIPQDEWRGELRKMKEGGINIVANYVFWNHVEEREGVFDWSGQRSLRRFLELCKEEGMPVVMRIGPFCHGEARCGGLPDWLVARKDVELRSEDPRFMHYVAQLYRQIFTQVQGLQWKDGGPLLACQFDNEFGGHGSYLMALKHLAQEVGFDLPFYTRTGWPSLQTPVPHGELIPLYGDYADGFWERSLEPASGTYWRAFHFSPLRAPTAIATEQLKRGLGEMTPGDNRYPFFTCELGGGMNTSYHRRIYHYPHDAYALAVVKLGSGSNLLGYYMYHGGTNPDGLTTLNEEQRTPYTNWNDLPVKTYDYQAPLGEFGQKNPHYYILRKLHLFLQDLGEALAPMPATFPEDLRMVQADDSRLRWTYRSAGDSGFIFVNNYERLQRLTAKRVRFDVCGVRFPRLTIPAGTTCIFPFRMAGLHYATAQLVARRDGKVYLEQVEGIPTTLALADGRVMRHVRPLGPDTPVAPGIYLLTPEQAGQLFLTPDRLQAGNAYAQEPQPVSFRREREAGPLRTITIGGAGVAQSPTDDDFRQAAVYVIDLPTLREGLLSIRYQGDCARLYADGKLVTDNFYNGREFLFGLWRLPQDTRRLELRILPMQPDEPVYFPAEADTTPGERVDGISLLARTAELNEE